MPKTKSTLLAKQHKSHFQWWVGVIIVCVVATAGILILRFSRAAVDRKVNIDCAPTDSTKQFSSSKGIVDNKNSISLSQQCMTNAFLNKYTEYHKEIGNLEQVSTKPQDRSTSEAALSGTAANQSLEPKEPTKEECPSLGTFTTPSQAKLPVINSSDKFKQSSDPGYQISGLTFNWLGATGQCFYQFIGKYYGVGVGYNTPWCAAFVSLIYYLKGHAIQGYGAGYGWVNWTVSGIVAAQKERLVPSEVVLAGNYTPSAGDMVIYEANGDSFYDHIGIVTASVEDNGKKYVISNEGNVRVDPNNAAPYVPDGINIVGRRSHTFDDPKILGYVRAPGNELVVPLQTSPPYNASDFSCPSTEVKLSTAKYIKIPTQVNGIASRNLNYLGGCVVYAQKLINAYNRTTQSNPPVALVEDGIFGLKTESASKLYQQQNSLSVDGIIGPQTWNSLINNCYVRLLCYK